MSEYKDNYISNDEIPLFIPYDTVLLKCDSCLFYNRGFCTNIEGLTGSVKESDFCSRGKMKWANTEEDKK